MTRRNLRIGASTLALAATFACGSAPIAVRAQPVPPASTGLAGKGDLVVQTALAGAPIGVGGRVAFETTGSLFRIDVLSLAIPGADPTLSAVLGTQLFPPGGFTVIVDRRSSTYTIWSTAKHTYYTHGFQRDARTPMPAATPAPLPSPGNGFDFTNAFKALRQLRDDKTFTMSISLTGHTTLFGHAVSAVQYQYAQTPLAAGGSSSDVHGEVDFADDFDEIPILFTASVSLKGIPPSSLRLELTQLTRANPDQNDFTPPPAFTKANSISDVVGGKVSF